ncbi:MAG: DmsC/YnfH family molybdoenzyme membrane anchor subunit [Bacteroidota bacterium]
MNKNYFIFDKNKCVGCEACVIACINENGFQEPESWRNIYSSNPEKLPGLPLFYLSMSCNHCEDAVCMENCPALAYSRSPITGAVLHTTNHCIGCKYCTWNCPYDAPKFNPISGIINKCNFCESRLIDNQEPACVSLCPTGALDFSFEEIDKSSIKSSINVPVSTQPSIVIKERIKKNGPEIDHSLFESIEITEPAVVKKISALKEWTLVLFTFIVSVMVGITAVNTLNQQSLNIKFVFLAVGAIAAGLSMFHLGKPFRAWRALLNIRKSWLSREILFFSLFYASTFIDLIVLDLPNWLLIVFGFMLLFSVDKLYQPVQVYWKTKFHSAQVIFISLSYFLLFNNLYWIFASLMGFRLYLFLIGIKQFEIPLKVKMIRILSLILTALFIVIGSPIWYTILIFTIGEIIDRIVFYYDLDVPDIKRHLAQK